MPSLPIRRIGFSVLGFGARKIDLHHAGNDFETKASQPRPGSADACFLIDSSLADLAASALPSAKVRSQQCHSRMVRILKSEGKPPHSKIDPPDGYRKLSGWKA
jgi:hypothetical protein